MRLVSACLTIAILSGLFVFSTRPIASTHAADVVPPAVRLVIDYGDGVQKHFTQLPWKKGITAFDALQQAAAHRRGIEFRHRGAGATAFVTQIDDLKNEGRKRNWVFRVNNKLAERSCGIETLKPGDTILWKFGEYR